MSIERAIGHILEHVDLERWDRPARLLRLVATLQDGPNPVPLGRRILEATGRTPREARYDHEVLVRLAERDRVLLRWRGQGRRPDCWLIGPLDRWSHVPWITPRRDVIAAFSGPEPGAAIPLWTKRAARAVRLGTETPLLEALAEAGLSVNLRSTTARPRSTTARDAGEIAPGSVHNGTSPAAPHYLPVNTLSPSLTPPPESEGAVKLAKAIAGAIGCPVTGASNMAKLDALISAHPDVGALVPRLAGYRTAIGAVDALVQMAAGAATPTAPPPDPEKIAANLRQRIANLRAYDPEDPLVEQLESQLADLGSEYADHRG